MELQSQIENFIITLLKIYNLMENVSRLAQKGDDLSEAVEKQEQYSR